MPLAASTAAVDAGLLTWAALLAGLGAMIVLDLKVGSAQKQMTLRTAAVWSGIWISLAIAFGAGLAIVEGSQAGASYFAGYTMEKALSLDNVFVFTLIFAALAVPREEQPRVLLWGILVALVLRAVFIFAGAEALQSYSWVAWPFAALLAWTGWRILRSGGERDEGAKIVDRVRRRFPSARPAVLALAAVALADVIFAVDSVPAILAITTDTFVVFAANAFALLGLRALFFLVSGAVARFAYLQVGLGVLLLGIAGKLAYAEVTSDKVPTAVTLGVIVGVLGVSVGASLAKERREAAAEGRGGAATAVRRAHTNRGRAPAGLRAGHGVTEHPIMSTSHVPGDGAPAPQPPAAAATAGSPAPEDPSAPKKRRNWWIWMSGVLLVAVVGLLIWGLSTKSDLDSTQSQVDGLQSQVEQGKQAGSSFAAAAKGAVQDLEQQLGANTEDLAAAEQDTKDAQQTADQAQKDADAAQQAAAAAGNATDKGKAEADQAKADAKAAESKATVALDCAKAYASALGSIVGADDVKAQAEQVREQLKGITTGCQAAFAGT